jgi:trehalose 6-phosphate phosphatase
MSSVSNKRLWFFDFDGTLSLIVPERSEAIIHPACKELLEQLVAQVDEYVAVLSSRLLDDLINRVGVPGVFLGGGSGIEWFVKGKGRWIADEKLENQLKIARVEPFSQIMKLAVIPGIEIEDKKWSVAVHTRNSNAASKMHIASILEHLSNSLKIRLFRGPEVIEVQFLPEINKAYGVQALCKFLALERGSSEIIYAGDDENDATAMEQVLRQGGIVFSVGRISLVEGARIVKDPQALVAEIRNVIGLKRGNRSEVDVCTISK